MGRRLPADGARVSGVGDARGGQSLIWLVTGAFLAAAIVGAILQALVLLAVLRPIEARETRARAELALAGVASAFAAAPSPPSGAELDSLLSRTRVQFGMRPALMVVRWSADSLTVWPSEFGRLAARLLSNPNDSHGDAPGEVLARHPLEHGGRVFGEILAVRRVPRGPRPGEPSASLLFLYIPIAVLLSAALGVLLVRLLARRLRALEALAARVAAGDFSARVADPRRDEIGRVAGQLDRMAERLAAARDELEVHEQQRRQLFANITHELATPLTSIRATAETMLDPGVSLSQEDRTRYVRGVLEESRRLDRLIRDLFELARLEAGATALELERLDWAALARNTLERFSPRYAAAGLSLVLGDAPTEAWVRADGARLEQVLDNLLVNALRYVPPGGHVALSLRRCGSDRDRWRLTVSDDGPGLPADELPRVFERFYRGAASRSTRDPRSDGGSGLGLAIVREIVERHGGEVRARSESPHGLAIDVELPMIP
jgi:signal transduction histidine kinase